MTDGQYKRLKRVSRDVGTCSQHTTKNVSFKLSQSHRRPFSILCLDGKTRKNCAGNAALKRYIAYTHNMTRKLAKHHGNNM